MSQSPLVTRSELRKRKEEQERLAEEQRKLLNERMKKERKKSVTFIVKN